jgi:uncharacterized membrane protein YkgB
MGYLTHHSARIRVTLERAAARHGLRLLRVSLGAVFIWFALPKFAPGLSAMDPLAVDTITALSLGTVTGDPARLLLATLEAAIGAGLLAGRAMPLVSVALLGHLAGTFTPLLLFADRMWTAPLVPGLEAQFILKNLVLVAAGIAVIGAHRAGGHAAGPAPVRAAAAALPAQRSVPR